MSDVEANVALLSGYIAAAINSRRGGEALYKVVLGRPGFLVVQSVVSGKRYAVDIEALTVERWEGFVALARLNDDNTPNGD